MSRNASLWPAADPDRFTDPVRLAGERKRLNTAARSAAMTRLRGEYTDRYDQLVAEERAQREAWLQGRIRRARERRSA